MLSVKVSVTWLPWESSTSIFMPASKWPRVMQEVLEVEDLDGRDSEFIIWIK